ncbi:MAG: thiamine pyrophosphate-dependent dehydrogenase E1 component subunit alpha [Candidatus Eremiobacteraeota bacterium]|nr:thiamine pyrophosphate-dependent dehydrogenase E1 component subunit alpha [Candidatus Eremiobacteraeota bacterium]MBC5806665.1 thiamine pyrophosphate-dependent dehydrogenase E1 component subunit alpha [Candidatus Eremiobacteraeota bacterium]MBC5807877.1 thiamine pyrophosphate-dependent dehydrogenase E1 component subunit alpha [Candidatus Eremiobacteraeota bacterium]PZR62752.1 MAG: 2-oxoisovalerate dehydrogenase [Candidatus Eremiobacter sp. RRmetagenome_bin22]
MKSEPQIRAMLPEGLSAESLRDMYYCMVLTRTCDDRAFALNRQGKIPFAATCQGHEGVQVGAAYALKRGTDWIVPYYRDTALAIAFGVTPREQLMCLFARKADVFSSGRQFPNHYSVPHKNIASISSIIAAHVTHGVGMALAFKMRKEPAVTLITFGEGSTSEGEWHEALNFAGIHKVPAVFLCENNEFAISVPQRLQMAVENVADRAAAYGLPGVICEGTDPVATYLCVREAVERARQGGGPTLIEAKCYRAMSHTSDDNQLTYRTAEEIEALKVRDPIPRFEGWLKERGLIDDGTTEELKKKALAEVNEATDWAEEQPPPTEEDLYTHVYASGPLS